MPILLLIVLVVLIAQFGFWDTFAAIIGAGAMIALLIALIAGAIGIAGYLVLRRR